MARGIRTWRVIAAQIAIHMIGGGLLIIAVYFAGG